MLFTYCFLILSPLSFNFKSLKFFPKENFNGKTFINKEKFEEILNFLDNSSLLGKLKVLQEKKYNFKKENFNFNFENFDKKKKKIFVFEELLDNDYCVINF